MYTQIHAIMYVHIQPVASPNRIYQSKKGTYKMINLHSPISETPFSIVVKFDPVDLFFIIFLFDPGDPDFPIWAVSRNNTDGVEVDLMCIVDFGANPIEDGWKTYLDPIDAWVEYSNRPNIALRNFVQPRPVRFAAYAA